MLIALTPKQETWLKARVAAGGFASIEEAAQSIIDERISEISAAERRAKKDRREVLRIEELSDADLAAIAAAEMDPRHNHLDDELR
jgi:hypothetical protein